MTSIRKRKRNGEGEGGEEAGEEEEEAEKKKTLFMMNVCMIKFIFRVCTSGIIES